MVVFACLHVALTKTDQAAFEFDQHLASETDPNRCEQDGVRRCRLQARKALVRLRMR